MPPKKIVIEKKVNKALTSTSTSTPTSILIPTQAQAQKTKVKTKQKPQPPPQQGSDKWKIENLPLSFTQILHISDIHIRPLQRHEEFQSVFDTTVADIKSYCEDISSVIVITGDIFDNKTIFRPETFKICRDFLKALARVAPLVVIAGNHDMMEGNTTRLDSITPIADDIPDLYYLKYSGLYTCENGIVFSVSSLYDKIFIKHSDIVASPYYNSTTDYIALYHGSLTGASTDSGYLVDENIQEDADEVDVAGSTRHRAPHDFDGYKAVLLGDIHKHQVFKTSTGSIAYAGSLIQQNHGETREGHGILVWQNNAGKYTCTLRPICNKYGFVDIHCFDGIWVNKNIVLPEYCYARLIIRNCTETQVELIRNELKDRVLNLTITKQQCISDNLTECEIPPDIKRKEDELEIIKEQSASNKFDTEALLALHQGYQSNVEEEERNKGMSTAVWRPVLLEFKNMFGYGDNMCNKIIFQRGITSISADNACGKTSIVNIILFSIFGRTPLKSGNSFTCDIINGKHDSGYVTILLNHGGIYYLIERRTVRKKTTKGAESSMIQKLNRYDFTCTIWESNINGDKVKNCTELRKNNNDTFINELFGDMEDFSLSNLLNNESSTNLLDMTPGDQIKKLKKLFRLEVYDTYRELNKAAVDQMEKDISTLQVKTQALRSVLTDDITEAKLRDIKDILDDNIRQYNIMEESNTQMLTEKAAVEAECTTLKGEVSVVSTTIIQPYLRPDGEASLRTKLEKYKDAVDTGENIEMTNYKIAETAGHISRIEAAASSIDDLPELDALLEEEEEILHNLEQYPTSSNISADKLRLIIGRKEEAEDNLQQQLSAIDICPEDTDIYDIEELKSQIVHLTSNLHTVDSKIRAYQASELYRDPPPMPVLASPTMPYQLQLVACRSEQNRISIENNAMRRNKSYQGEISSDALNILYKSLHPVPNVKYEINSKALHKAEAELLKAQDDVRRLSSDIIVDTQEYLQILEDCPLVDANIKETYDLDKNSEYVLVEETLINKVVAHLGNEKDKGSIINSIQKLQQHISLKEQEIYKIHEHIDINNLIEENHLTQGDIDEIKYHLNEGRIMDLETRATELEALVAQQATYASYTTMMQQLDELEEERQAHINNKSLQEKINIAELLLQRQTLTCKLKAVQQELTEHRHNLDVCQLRDNLKSVRLDIKRHKEYNSAKGDLSRYRDIAQSLDRQLRQQTEFDTYVMLQEAFACLNAYHKNQSLQGDLCELQKNIISLDEMVGEQKIRMHKLDTIIRDQGKHIAVYSDQLVKQQEIRDKLSVAENSLVLLEKDIIPYNQYNILMGSKGITSKLLYIKIKSIELYINTIIETFTKYKIHILYDDKKQTISIITEDIETHNYLSTERLSGYEKLMLQIAFKRALNKFSYNSKSSLMIIDESLGCIDDNNFHTKLPNVMNMITQDYSTCLAISQRDFSHISDNVITIRKQNGTSIICQ